MSQMEEHKNENASKRNVTNSIRDDIAKMMKDTFGTVDLSPNIATVVPPPPKLDKITNNNILSRIFGYMTNKYDYVPRISKSRKARDYNAREREVTKVLWRMSGVCHNFKNYFYIFMRDKQKALQILTLKQYLEFPRPPIGLRIQPKIPKMNMDTICCEPQKVLLYIYGYFSANNFCMSCDPSQISATIYPAVIQTQLIIQGFVLDDGLVEMVQKMDTSLVEEVYFNDIKGVELESYTIADLVNIFPNAMEIRFLGDTRFKSLACISSAHVPDMENNDIDELPPADLIKKYHDIDNDGPHSVTKIKRNLQRLVRETEALGERQVAKISDTESRYKAVKRLSSYLNTPPEKRAKEISARDEIHYLQERLRVLQAIEQKKMDGDSYAPF